jgi:hypothetical protein
MKEGAKRGLDNLKIAVGMIKKGRMHLGMPHKVAGQKGLRAILEKAAEIEARDAQGGKSS